MLAYVLFFFLWVFLDSIKQKKYQYTVTAVIILLYFVFDVLQSDYHLSEHSQLFGWIQKFVLLVLAGYQIVVFLKSADRKKNLLVTALAVAACVCRFLRTVVFDHYTEMMKAQASEAFDLLQNMQVPYVIVNSATRLMLLLVLFCIVWPFGKTKATNG